MFQSDPRDIVASYLGVDRYDLAAKNTLKVDQSQWCGDTFKVLVDDRFSMRGTVYVVIDGKVASEHEAKEWPEVCDVW